MVQTKAFESGAGTAAAQTDAAAPLRGILLMLATLLCFVVMDLTAKALTQDYPVPQVVWARYTFHVVAMIVVLVPRGRLSLRTRRLKLQLFRSAILLAATLTFITGLSYMPLADASAITFVSPLLVAALSVPILREQVGPRRWFAVVIGFIGVLVILRPGLGVMNPAAVLILVTAFCFALFQIITRLFAATENPLTTLFYSGAFGTVCMTVVVPFFWLPPTGAAWVMMVATGLLGGFGHFLLIKAHGCAPASLLAPFVYTQLIWATLGGYVVFGDFPDAWTILGALVIAASGLFVLYREGIARSEQGDARTTDRR